MAKRVPRRDARKGRTGMRILHIIASIRRDHGGPIAGILAQDSVTKGMGVTREIVSLDRPSSPWIRGFPIRTFPLGLNRPVMPLRYTPHIIPWLRRNMPHYDAVIVNGLWNFATFAAARVLPGSGVPYFVFTHGMLDPWFRQTYPVKHWAKQISWWLNEGPLLHNAKAVLFTSEQEAALAAGQFFGWSYTPLVVPYGCSAPPPMGQEQARALRSSITNLRDRPYFLFLGRLHRKKGLSLTLEGFAAIAEAHPQLDLVIAGPDQEGLVPRLREHSDRLGLSDRVRFIGMIEGETKWALLRGAQAFVLTSHSENFGISVAEALSQGIPVLISEKVNIHREISKAHCGLVEPDTVDGGRRLLKRFMLLTETEKTQLSLNARNFFNRYLSAEQSARGILDLITRLK